MSMFRLPRSLQIPLDKIRNNFILETHYYQPRQKERFLPVTRYALGMSKSLYFENHPEGDDEFCGTFFYLEKESSTFLRYNTAHVSFSKFTAYQELKRLYYELVGNDASEIEEVGKYDEFQKHISERAFLNTTYMAYLSGLLHKDLQYTPSQYMDLLRKGFVEYSCFGRDREETVPKFANPEASVYIGSCPNVHLYAAEDALDQPLCILGKILGIDLIIFKYMIGSRQVVAEALDTRPRDLCFQNLVFAQ